MTNPIPDDVGTWYYVEIDLTDAENALAEKLTKKHEPSKKQAKTGRIFAWDDEFPNTYTDEPFDYGDKK
jgi:hypothetical protein